MKTYKITFRGREKNAIGISYTITDFFSGENEDQARISMYDKYDHILVMHCEEVRS